MVSDSARVTELSRLYDALWLDVDHINVSLSTLKLLSADQQTLIKQCITKATISRTNISYLVSHQ